MNKFILVGNKVVNINYIQSFYRTTTILSKKHSVIIEMRPTKMSGNSIWFNVHDNNIKMDFSNKEKADEYYYTLQTILMKDI